MFRCSTVFCFGFILLSAGCRSLSSSRDRDETLLPTAETAAMPPLKPSEPPIQFSDGPPLKLPERPPPTMAAKLIQLPGKAAAKLGELPEKAFEAATPSGEWLERHEVIKVAVNAVGAVAILALIIRCGGGGEAQ